MPPQTELSECGPLNFTTMQYFNLHFNDHMKRRNTDNTPVINIFPDSLSFDRKDNVKDCALRKYPENR